MYGKTYKPDDRVDFYYEPQGANPPTKAGWKAGYVTDALEEMVRVVSMPAERDGAAVSQWVEIEGDRLAPANTMTQSDKAKFHALFLELLDSSMRA